MTGHSPVFIVDFIDIKTDTSACSEHTVNINKAANYLVNNEVTDMTIISGINQEIKTNKYLLSVFIPKLRPLLSNLCCTSPTLLLPDCSTSSIKHLLNIITAGSTYTDEVTLSEINEVIDTAKLLSIDMRGLTCVGNANRERNEIFDNGNISVKENDKSVPKEEDITEKTMIGAGMKRKREVDHKMLRESKHERNYSCILCDYIATQAAGLRRHVGSIHKKVWYPCDKCNFKATDKSNLKKHIKVKHEGDRYSCDHCDYKATQKGPQ